ncbi:POM121-like protein 2 [Mirounga leonina]|uniref:POM121-like protein 2 n=1 Tax=Mirounga leonina TaxID=9715 RepID=UPI00156C4EE6|nr:POM121-like protein 2 [Mirounga leonina]
MHRERWIRRPPHPTLPPHLDQPRVQRAIVPKAWRRCHGKSPLHTFLGLDFSSNRESFVKQWLWKAQNLRNIWNMRTINITPAERSGSFSRGPPIQEQPDSCAKETRLRARSPCQKGKKRIHRPLQFEAPHAKRRRPSPGAGPSAFKPVCKDGVVPSFVPRPGPLRRGLCSWHPGILVTERTPTPGLTCCQGTTRPPQSPRASTEELMISTPQGLGPPAAWGPP